MLIRNPATGAIGDAQDPTAYLEQGWEAVSPEEAAAEAERLDYSTFGQQAQAQAERVVRGATLGLVEGFGDDASNRARERYSREEHPALSFAADVAPDVALSLASGGAAGALGAGRLGVLAAESAASGLVGAGQEAYAEGRHVGDDPGRDAENALLWGGLAFGLGGIPLARDAWRSRKAGAELAADAARAAAGDVETVARAAEADHLPSVVSEAPSPAAVAPEATIPSEPLTEAESAALNNAKSSLGFLRKPPEKFRETLDAALEKTRVENPGTLYRGMRVSPDELDGFIRDGYQLDTLTTASVSQQGAERFAGGVDAKTPVLMRLEGTPRASMAHGYAGDAFPDEATAILEPGTRYRVQSVEDVDIPPEMEWMGPQKGKLLSLQAEVPLPPQPSAAGEAAARELAEREVTDDGLERGLRAASSVDAQELVQRAVRSVEPETSSFGRQQRLYQNRAAIQDVMVREAQQDLTGLAQDIREISGAQKASEVAAKVGDNLGAQRRQAQGVAVDAATLAGQLRAEARAFAHEQGASGLHFEVPGTKALVTSLLEHGKLIEGAETGKGLFETLDSFKRVLDDTKLSLEQGAANSTDPLAHQKLIPRVQELAGKVRQGLEDAATWGTAGQMQREFNAIIHDRLMPSARIFEESVLKRTHRGYDAMWNTEGWESKIDSLLRGNDPGRRRHVGTVLDAAADLASVGAKYGDSAVAERLTGRVDKIRRTLGLADELQNATERMDAVKQIVPFGAGKWITGDMANAFRRLTNATDSAVDRSVDDWVTSSRVRGGGKAGRIQRALAYLSDENRQLFDLAKRRGISHTMALFQGEDDSPQAAFERARGALIDDSRFFEYLGNDYRSMQQQSPETFMLLAGRATQLRKFLLDRMPANVAVSIARPDGYPPSREAIEDWAVYWNAARQPMRVVRNLPAARLQELQTLKRGYPRLYERVQQRLIERVGTAQAAGESLDDTFMMRMGIIMGMDTLGGPLYSKQLARFATDYIAAQKAQQQPQTQPRPPAPSGPVQSVAQNGVTFGTGF